MLNISPFYSGQTKAILGAFGSLFNDMQIVRTVGNSTKTVNVPLSYASADKAYSRRVEDGDMNFNMKRIFPRMAFNMLGIEHDPDRKLQSMNYTLKSATSTTATMQLQPVPYNIQVELYVAVSNIEDGLQIIEQILPFFNPEFMIKTKDFPSLNIMRDTPVVLNNVSFQDNTPDSEYTEDRNIEWTLSFTIKSFMYGPVSTVKVIKQVKLFTFDEDTNLQLSTVTVDAVSGPNPTVATTTIEEPGAALV